MTFAHTKQCTRPLQCGLNVRILSQRSVRAINSSSTASASRTLSTGAKLKDLTKREEGEEEDDLLASLTRKRGGRTKKGVTKMSPREWLLGEDGIKFRDPIIGNTNWIGGEIPFPTNPWFKPQAPLSDLIREKVYNSFKTRVAAFQSKNQDLPSGEKDREEKLLIRQTAEQWGISRDRVAAIIRLKAMEESWTSLSGPDQSDSRVKKALQLNFEKGMENVLGVEKNAVPQVDEDVNEIPNRRQHRKASFFGMEFVPLDSAPTSSSSSDTPLSDKVNLLNRSRKYQEPSDPSEHRHIIGPDGIPRPPACYISKPPGKIPMVFTDVSNFPRAPKPMSKRKARYFPKTSLLPNLSSHHQSPGPTRSSRRTNCTLATLPVQHSSDSRLAKTSALSHKDLDSQRLQEEKKDIAAQLLRQIKGCADSTHGLKLLDTFEATQSTNSTNTKVNDREIVEAVLLQAGGLSFGKSSNNELGFSTREVTISKNDSPEEQQISDIRYDLIKSIYMRKLELNSSGRLLLPKSVRSKEEKDQQILSSHTGLRTVIEGHRQKIQPTPSSSVAQPRNRSNRMVKQCMKGPLARIKQRELAIQNKMQAAK